MTTKIFEAIVKYPKAILVMATLITAILLFPLAGLKPDNSINVWYKHGEESFRRYRQFISTFGNDANITIIYRNDELFTKEQLSLNRHLTARLLEMKNIKQVRSLTNLSTVKPGGVLPIPVPLVDENRTDLHALRKEITSNKALIDHVISRDGKATALALDLFDLHDTAAEEVIAEISVLLGEPEFRANQYHLLGGIPILVEMNRLSNRESVTFVTANVLIIFILLWMILKSVKFAMATIIIAVVSTLWAMGWYAGHHTLNMITGIMPLIILVISVADSVHFFWQYTLARSSEPSPKQVVLSALKGVWVPCLFTTLTTAVAFLAFLFSSIPPLQSLGLYTALGVIIAYLLTFTLLPALLLVTQKDHKIQAGKSDSLLKIPGIAELPGWTLRCRKEIIGIAGIIMILSAWGLAQVRFETDQIRYLRPDNPIRIAADLAQQWFEGIYPLEIVLRAPDKKHFFRRENLRLIRDLERDILEDRAVKTLFSPMTFLMQAQKDLSSHESRDLSFLEMIPGLDAVLSAGKDGLRRFLSPDGDQLRISVLSRWLDNRQLEDLIARIGPLVSSACEKAGLKGLITGYSVMYVDLNRRLLKSQISSFAISFSMIFVMLFLLSKKWSIAALGMIPNILPILTTLGIIGWLGIKLDVATVLIAAISLGITVDDTVHLIYAYSRHGEKDSPYLLEFVMRRVGHPVVMTSVILIGGFSVMMFSSFLPIFYFGAFVSLNVFFALLYDLALLPVLLDPLHQRRQGHGGEMNL